MPINPDIDKILMSLPRGPLPEWDKPFAVRRIKKIKDPNKQKTTKRVYNKKVKD